MSFQEYTKTVKKKNKTKDDKFFQTAGSTEKCKSRYFSPLHLNVQEPFQDQTEYSFALLPYV